MANNHGGEQSPNDRTISLTGFKRSRTHERSAVA